MDIVKGKVVEHSCMFNGCETGASYAVGIPTSVGMVWLCQFCRDKVLKFIS